MVKSFEGKTVLVTGASAGIGAEFAKQFHGLGASLVLVARRLDRLERVATTFNQTREGSAEVLRADLSLETDLAKVVELIKSRDIDILVNNAGRGSFGYFEQLELEEELEMIRLNVVAPVVLAHAVLPQMKSRKCGALVTVSSIAAFQPLPYMATYAATKGFDYLHSMALRAELSEFGVKALAVCPGPTATEFGGVARVPGTFTGGGRDGVEKVVSESISSLCSNHAAVVPCLRPKLIATVSKLLPKRISTWVTKKVLDAPLRSIVLPPR